ncbi:MAG: hypothetical protein P8M80_05355 [Pirellulaceae bacterium]|nr:hypothetical protein [Pirellulaceae bacterium]
MNDLATLPGHKADVDSMLKLMESWRKRLDDPYPLTVPNPEPKKPKYDNSKRVLDVWQPKWIRDKYFNGRSPPSRPKRSAAPKGRTNKR